MNIQSTIGYTYLKKSHLISNKSHIKLTPFTVDLHRNFKPYQTFVYILFDFMNWCMKRYLQGWQTRTKLFQINKVKYFISTNSCYCFYKNQNFLTMSTHLFVPSWQLPVMTVNDNYHGSMIFFLNTLQPIDRSLPFNH